MLKGGSWPSSTLSPMATLTSRGRVFGLALRVLSYFQGRERREWSTSDVVLYVPFTACGSDRWQISWPQIAVERLLSSLIRSLVPTPEILHLMRPSLRTNKVLDANGGTYECRFVDHVPRLHWCVYLHLCGTMLGHASFVPRPRPSPRTTGCNRHLI